MDHRDSLQLGTEFTLEAKVEEVDWLLVWWKELQDVRDNKEVGYHKTMIMLRNPEEEMEVTQMYMKEDGKVLCCIIPGGVVNR